MAIRRVRAAVLALHWQVNVIRPEGFFGPMLAAPVAASGVMPRAIEFHAAALALGVPVVFTRFTIPVGEGEFVRNTGFMRSVGAAQTEFRPDSSGTAIISEMAAQPTEVFDNQKLSGLAGSKLPEWLTDQGIRTLFVTGVATNLTVEQTARHGTDLGFTVHPVADCVAAASAGTHEAALADLELVTAGSVTAERALGLLGQG
ncbi:cysteine hydrolase [Nocardia sp. NPDC049220]|uniref:cysteine hydrolase n=1 Tax=Nocardia sp. NPDC049220 TaxID=3155273 RepID=UPI0033FFDC45